MNDEYTQLKRDLEEIDVTVRQLQHAIRRLIAQCEQSDHPLRHERVSQLQNLYDCLTGA